MTEKETIDLRRMFIIGFCLALLIGGTAEAAVSEWLDGAELNFVDAVDSTGYYVDMNSISILSQTESTARIAIIKADENRMFLYTAHFDRKLETYRIMHSVILQYDTKETLSLNERPMAPIKYQVNSPIARVVEYIYNPRP